jgi:hypothetical protein
MEHHSNWIQNAEQGSILSGSILYNETTTYFKIQFWQHYNTANTSIMTNGNNFHNIMARYIIFVLQKQYN